MDESLQIRHVTILIELLDGIDAIQSFFHIHAFTFDPKQDNV
jgi:hypothetical protein